MESLFPQLFFLSFFAPIVLRAAIAAILLYDAKNLWGDKSSRLFATGLALLGVVIGAGLFTQAAVLGGMIMASIAYFRMKDESLFGNGAVYLLSLSIFLFLFIAGPGGFAFDLPY